MYAAAAPQTANKICNCERSNAMTKVKPTASVNFVKFRSQTASNNKTIKK